MLTSMEAQKCKEIPKIYKIIAFILYVNFFVYSY